MDRELFLEIGVEELPAAWLPGLNRQLAEKLDARLREMRLPPDVNVEAFSTPRRLTACVARMPERQEDFDETITGPPVSAALDAAGEPTPAALGFARKQDVAFEALERVETPKGTYLAARKHHRGRSTVDVLPDLLAALLRDLAFPKQMRWDAMLEDGKGELVFGRPIRWLVYLYGGRVVPFTIGRLPGAAGTQVQDVTTGAVTHGHRFLATSGRAGRSVRVRSFEEYRTKLSEHFVILDHGDRRGRIARELESKARKLGGRVSLRDHASLVDEVADLVEYPGVVAGFFPHDFLSLPHEVLTTTLVHHQHYFPVVTEQGRLKEAFLAVVNTQPSDERLIAKNAERVVVARLRDAKFFWDADRTVRLEDRLERLHTIVFHKKLGSYRDKAERIEPLARAIASNALGAGAETAEHAARAAKLAKADLATDMVFEFPELQGVMGGIYAREEGRPEPVWKAIYYHYLPITTDPDPGVTSAGLGSAGPSWAAVSLADKLDTLIGLLAKDERVSGSKDPFGLRRAATGIVRTLQDLRELTGSAARPRLGGLVDEAWSGLGLGAIDRAKKREIGAFLLDRVRHLMQVRGLAHEEIQTVTADPDVLDRLSVPDLFERAAGLAAAIQTPEFAAVAEAFKRANNIVEQEWGRRDPRPPWGHERGRLHEPAELALEAVVRRLETAMKSALSRGDVPGALQAIGSLREPLEAFFSQVRVDVRDGTLKEARLALLAEIRDRIRGEFGDISLMAARRAA